jgi:decaprenylphospho-beta-D-ribofuranose 2-oxidase
MSTSRAMFLTGWGRTHIASTIAYRTLTTAEVPALINSQRQLTAHGLGRSYGDVALPPVGEATLITTVLDGLISFDEATGLLVAEAGVSFKTLLEIFLPRGWLIPVAPGTSYVTLGGAIANNVHGKNHPVNGALSRHIEWVEVATADGQVQRFSRTQNPQFFFATLGGLGLTGIILRAALRLQKVPGSCMAVTQHRCKNLDELMAAFKDKPASDDYAVAWLDALGKGARLGRSIFERANVCAGAAPVNLEGGPAVPLDLPSFALNPLTVGVFNRLRYALVGRAQPTLHTLPIGKFFYPLDRIRHWNRLYGLRGFHQFQCVIPDSAPADALSKLLEKISSSSRASFLAVLKRLGGEDESLLSYALPGWVVALDFPASAGVEEFLQSLIKLTRDAGGRIYLAKDSVLQADDFAAMYPRLPEFRAALAALDPTEKFTSQMALRLGLRSRQ